MKIKIKDFMDDSNKVIENILKSRGMDFKKIIDVYARKDFQKESSARINFENPEKGVEYTDWFSTKPKIDIGFNKELDFSIRYNCEEERVEVMWVENNFGDYTIFNKSLGFGEYIREKGINFVGNGIRASYDSKGNFIKSTFLPFKGVELGVKIISKGNKLESSINEDNFRGVSQNPKRFLTISGDNFSVYDFFEGKITLKDESEIKYCQAKVPLRIEEIELQ